MCSRYFLYDLAKSRTSVAYFLHLFSKDIVLIIYICKKNIYMYLFKEQTPYHEQLADERWLVKKQEILSIHHHKCSLCKTRGDEKNPLEIHHKYYIFGNRPWDYNSSVLVPLCRNCHHLIHETIAPIAYADIKDTYIPTSLSPCKRCNGLGYFTEFAHKNNGCCYKCNGYRFEELINSENVSIENYLDQTINAFDIKIKLTPGESLRIGLKADDYLFGRNGVKKDLEEAYDKYYIAAINGSRRAQAMMGLMTVCKKDGSIGDALRWFSYSSMQGHTLSKMMISTICRIGLIEPKKAFWRYGSLANTWDGLCGFVSENDIAISAWLGVVLSRRYENKEARDYYANILKKLALYGNECAKEKLEYYSKRIKNVTLDLPSTKTSLFFFREIYKETKKIFKVKGVSFTMINVEGGAFSMGNLHGFPGSTLHRVVLSDYCIGQTEVTQELWLAVMGNNPSFYSSRNHYNDNLQRPVDSISWDDCQMFIDRLNQLTGEKFRLPTEAEWEFAAKGGKKSRGFKYAGSDNIYDVAWFLGNTPSTKETFGNQIPQPVGTKAPNEIGLYDMTGNVLEWCQDWHDERFGIKCNHYHHGLLEGIQINPQGPPNGQTRVLRGGGLVYERENEIVNRLSGEPTYGKNSRYGMRLAL